MVYHNDFEKIYEAGTFKKPINPSNWVSVEPTYQEVTEITMSCGGGMGGSRWNEYVERTALEVIARKNGCLTARRYTGERVVLNTRFLVMARQLTIASMTIRSENPYFPGLHTYRILVADGHKLRLEE